LTHFFCHLGKRFGKHGPIALPFISLLAFFLGTGCLGLTANERQPDTDDEVPNDCTGVSCWEPPENGCTPGDELLIYAPSGYCSGGICSYASGQESCHSGLCEEGVCVTTPCQGMTCIDPPPAFCAEEDRTIYAPSGYCSGGSCDYAKKTTPCAQICVSGACQDSPCAEVFCRKPPAPYCRDDSNLFVFSPEGRCVVVEGLPQCLHKGQALPCPGGCVDGRCQGDPCVGVVCDRPPARYCDGAVMVVFGPYGVCDANGFCRYTEQRHPCIEPCVDAQCGEDDACTWVTCNEPPASYCHDLFTQRIYDRDGLCQGGFCSYIHGDINCPDGCEEGRCNGAPDDDMDTGMTTDNDTDTVSQGANETISRQAEDYDTFDFKGDSHGWYLVSTEQTPDVEPDPDPSHADSANGGAYLEALPDDDSGTYSSSSGPQIGFHVTIGAPGRFYIWVRAFSSGPHDNTLHVGVDGTWPDSGRNIQLLRNEDRWMWSSNQRDSGGDVFGIPNTIWLDIDTPGEHHVTFAMREDGFEFDEWIMTTDMDFVPE